MRCVPKEVVKNNDKTHTSHFHVCFLRLKTYIGSFSTLYNKYKRETFLPVRFSTTESTSQEAGTGGTGKADYCPLLSGLYAPERSVKSRGVCVASLS